MTDGWRALALGAVLSAAVACGDGAAPRSIPTTVAFERSALAALLIDSGLDARLVRAETLSACMRERGFTYDLAVPADDAAPGLDDRTYVERYGYGILLPPPPGPAPDESAIQAREAAMTPAEAEAYHRALLGSPRADAPPSPDSCLGRADAVITALADQVADARVTDLLAAYDAAVLADPRMVAVEQAWVACVRGQGYEVSSRDDIVAELLALDSQGLTGAELERAQGRELEIAKADFECSADEPRVRAEVERDVSPRFVTEMDALLLARG